MYGYVAAFFSCKIIQRIFSCPLAYLDERTVRRSNLRASFPTPRFSQGVKHNNEAVHVRPTNYLRGAIRQSEEIERANSFIRYALHSALPGRDWSWLRHGAIGQLSFQPGTRLTALTRTPFRQFPPGGQTT